MLTDLVIVVCIAYVAYWGGRTLGMLIFWVSWPELLQDVRNALRSRAFEKCRDCSARELCEAEQAERDG